ncbi:MAG TPA: hypothetical protein VK829_16470, partial [Terriglobales bacterium]|nr:hypothetical protein [Terriglobales bacterium]
LNPAMKTIVMESIKEAFVFGFRIVIFICAGLSLASAVVAWLMIPQDRDRPKAPEGLRSSNGL